jgi:hypothetical protein
MERKLLEKSSPRIRHFLPTVLRGILLTRQVRYKHANEGVTREERRRWKSKAQVRNEIELRLCWEPAGDGLAPLDESGGSR